MNETPITVLTVIGARPQIIKAAVLSAEFAKNDLIEETLVHTGQHYDHNLSQALFDELDVPNPKYNLGLGNLNQLQMVGRMIEGIGGILDAERPNYVLVYGDTNSSLAAAFSAYRLNLPIAHVEAGMRCGDLSMPEEQNRVLIDQMSTILFCPSEASVNNLTAEGFPRKSCQSESQQIVLVGDIMFDLHAQLFERNNENKKREGMPDSGKRIFCTIHRMENTDDKQALTEIVDGLGAASGGHEITLSLHPRTSSRLNEFGLSGRLSKIEVVPPMTFKAAQNMIASSDLVITDSGGLQKEAYYHRVPCITIRDSTEWVETVTAGWNKLVPPRSTDLLKAVQSVFIPKPWRPLYGDGHAGARIVDSLVSLRAGAE